MKKAFSYLLYAVVIWITALGINYVSYSISDATAELRKDISLVIEQSEIPHSSVKDTDVNIVSFNQRGVSEQKKNFQEFLLSQNFLLGYVLSNEIVIPGRYVSDYRFFKLPPFDFLSHQFLI